MGFSERGSSDFLGSTLRLCDHPRRPRDHASAIGTEPLARRVVETTARAFHQTRSCLERHLEATATIAAELLVFRILSPAIRTLHCHSSFTCRLPYDFLLGLPFRCRLILCLMLRFLLLGDLRYEIITPPFAVHSCDYIPMDVMTKSSLSISRIRIVERPHDVLVTDPTPGRKCTSSASYGSGHTPDKGTK